MKPGQEKIYTETFARHLKRRGQQKCLTGDDRIIANFTQIMEDFKHTLDYACTRQDPAARFCKRRDFFHENGNFLIGGVTISFWKSNINNLHFRIILMCFSFKEIISLFLPSMQAIFRYLSVTNKNGRLKYIPFHQFSWISPFCILNF